MIEENKEAVTPNPAAKVVLDFMRAFHKEHKESSPPFILLISDDVTTNLFAGGTVEDFAGMLGVASVANEALQKAVFFVARKIQLNAMQAKARSEAIAAGVIDADGKLTEKGKVQADEAAGLIKELISSISKPDTAADAPKPVDEPEVAAAKKESGQ